MDSKRDWGHASDYVRAMYLMLQAPEPDDYVIATGQTRTVREFVLAAFEHAGIDLAFEGDGLNEVGREKGTGRVLVKVNPAFFRPAEVELLLGDASKAEKQLGWKREVSFSQLVERMVRHDLHCVQEEHGAKDGEGQ